MEKGSARVSWSETCPRIFLLSSIPEYFYVKTWLRFSHLFKLLTEAVPPVPHPLPSVHCSIRIGLCALSMSLVLHPASVVGAAYESRSRWAQHMAWKVG